MKKKISLLFAIPILFLGLYFSAHPNLSCAFSTQSVCQAPLKIFSDGNSTFQVTYPPGGGTTCTPDVPECPKISLPAGSTVYSIKVDMQLTDPTTEVGTPYIWVPISGSNQIAQIGTKTAVEIARYGTGINPSRTFVIPGGDTWVANRSNGANLAFPNSSLTKLSPLTGTAPAGGTCGDGACGTDETTYSCKVDCSGNVCGSGAEDCRKYKFMGNFPTGGTGPRGVTGDINGDIWVGNYDTGNIVKLNPVTGAIITSVNVGGNPYGLIADQFGYVWVSNKGSSKVQAVNVNTGMITQSVAIDGPYGIGMNSRGDVLVATCCGTPDRMFVINGFGGGTPGTIKASAVLTGGVSTRGRGVAADLNDNIWVGSDTVANGTIYSFKPDGSTYCSPYNSPHDTVGVAIDFDNNVWAVPYDGHVLKLTHDSGSPCTVSQVADVNLSGFLYNYSDMTGLRTIQKMLTMSDFTVPLSDSGTFDVCTDGTGTCTDAGPCAPISAILASCTPDSSNKCEIPLSISSVQSGEYTLQNLEIIYGSEEPVTTGGLVPCGRRWDDPNTPIREDAPCDFCHIMYLVDLVMDFLISFVAIITILALLLVGYLFITSAGDSQKRKDAKNRFKWVLIGFIIVFLAWLIVDFLFTVWGFADPMGGKWYVTCE